MSKVSFKWINPRTDFYFGIGGQWSKGIMFCLIFFDITIKWCNSKEQAENE